VPILLIYLGDQQIISWRTCSRTKSLEIGLIVGLNLTRGASQAERHDLLSTDRVLQNRSWLKLETARDSSGISEIKLDGFLRQIGYPRRRKCIHAQEGVLGQE